MRALAASLRSLAGPLGAIDRVDLQNWESPRGREIKAQIEHGSKVAAEVADQLRQLATEVSRAADGLEDEQLDWAVAYSRWINRDSEIPKDKI
ncbi:MAG TPA: hypothetical protein VF062_02320 [Candidatus Limnocylindrales bacterium]